MFKKDRQLRQALDFSLAHTVDNTAMCAIFGALGSLVETDADLEALETAQRGILALLGGFAPTSTLKTTVLHLQPTDTKEGHRAMADTDDEHRAVHVEELSAEDASLLLAFAELMECRRKQNKISAWRVTRGDHWFAEVLTVEQRPFVGGGDTFDEARIDLSNKMIAAALDGWPGAGTA